jgi:hypothetical protein
VFNNSNEIIEPTNIKILDSNSCQIDLSGFNPTGTWKVVVRIPIVSVTGKEFKVLVLAGSNTDNLDLTNATITFARDFVSGKSPYQEDAVSVSNLLMSEMRTDIIQAIYHSSNVKTTINPTLKFASTSNSGLCPQLLDVVRDIDVASVAEVPSERAVIQKLAHFNPDIEFQNGE